MNLFQIFSTFTIAVSSAKIIALFLKGRLKITELFFWLGIWLVGLVVILFPALSVKIAHLFGIQRGADLIIYTSILVIFLVLYRILLKIRDVEEKIGKIVSSLTVRDDRITNESSEK